MQHPIHKGMKYIGPAYHPRDGLPGTLYLVERTGMYLLAFGGSFRSVPARWATGIAASA